MDLQELSFGNYIMNPKGAIGTYRGLREVYLSEGETILMVTMAYTKSQKQLPPYEYFCRLIPSEIQPVILNEDILEAVGFQRNGVFWDYDNREETDDVIGFRLGQISNGFVLLTNFRTISVRYLHQLQNLMIQAGIKDPLELPLDDTFHFKNKKK